ncbi:MAG: YesL family protein [Clostridia bacterium]|nr:YesL family protein [Clostridia bacterium]
MAKIITKDTKPGKGIEKDAPEKRRFFLFFELFFGKFFKLVTLNFLYFVTLLPLIVGINFSVMINPLIEKSADILKYTPIIFTPTIPGVILLVVSIFITGPATAGFVYVIRNIQRREHTWIFSDFFKQFKKNYKQGLAMSAIDIPAYLVLVIALLFYLYIMPVDAPEAGTVMPFLGAVFVGAVTLVFTWAHYYIYTMMVTFELNFSKLFKNSLIFAIGKLPLNLLISVFVIAVIALNVYVGVLVPAISGILLPVISLSLIGFIIVFSTYPTIDKMMIQKASKRVLNTRG